MTSSSASLVARWERAASLLVSLRDVLEGRPGFPGAEAPLDVRGWSSFLLDLDDATLESLEIHGQDGAWAGAPMTLVAFVNDVRAATEVPVLLKTTRLVGAPRRHETPKKQAQIAAFVTLIAPLAERATRVLDVGSGHGHLTRDLATLLGVSVLGLERDASLAARARQLASRAEASAAFLVTDVLREGLVLRDDDCVVGLHACGELGDALTAASASSGAALALVGCCLQKRRAAARAPLSATQGNGATGRALVLPRELLGLSNLSAGDDGVEATRSENLVARARRLALHRLLAQAGCSVTPGAEIEGLNRRAAHRDLGSLVERAFALRSLVPPSAAAIAEAAAFAEVAHGRQRRLALPRSLLARVLEVFVLLDRALHLAEHGRTVAFGTLFSRSVSPRNLALTAARAVKP